MGVELSLTEWVTLAVVAEGPTHGFAVARELTRGSDIGRVLTVHRPAVYRAIDRLVDGGLITTSPPEPGAAGPTRTPLRASRRGHASVRHWLNRPVEHVRDFRIEFVVKLRLRQRRGLDLSPLVETQRSALSTTLDTLVGNSSADVVDIWRRHSAEAAASFLDVLGGSDRA